MSVNNPAECSKGMVMFARALIVGVVSSLLSTVVINIIASMHTRNFQFCKSWTHSEKQALLEAEQQLNRLFGSLDLPVPVRTMIMARWLDDPLFASRREQLSPKPYAHEIVGELSGQ